MHEFFGPVRTLKWRDESGGVEEEGEERKGRIGLERH
jgi:hypothetical protein